MKTIKVISEFNKRPFGRYPEDGDWSGEKFRDEYLFPALEETDDSVTVDLSGYNRYGPSFIDEAFGGLIHKKNMALEDVEKKLVIQHDDLPSIVELAWIRIRKAAENAE